MELFVDYAGQNVMDSQCQFGTRFDHLRISTIGAADRAGADVEYVWDRRLHP